MSWPPFSEYSSIPGPKTKEVEDAEDSQLKGQSLSLVVRPKQCRCPVSGVRLLFRHEWPSVCLLAGWPVLARLSPGVSGLRDPRRVLAGPQGASARLVRGFVGRAHSGSSKDG